MEAGAEGNAKGDVHNAQGDMDLSEKNGGNELSNAYLKRAEDNLKFYVESSDEDKEG